MSTNKTYDKKIIDKIKDEANDGIVVRYQGKLEIKIVLKTKICHASPSPPPLSSHQSTWLSRLVSGKMYSLAKDTTMMACTHLDMKRTARVRMKRRRSRNSSSRAKILIAQASRVYSNSVSSASFSPRQCL